MTRIAPIPTHQMSATQRQVADEILAGPRGAVIGPLAIWLHNVELADRAQKLGEYVRYQTALPARLSELVILITAREWTAQFEWHIHEPFALAGGLSQTVIDAIRERRTPDFEQPDEALVHEFCTTLYGTRTVPQALYDRAVEQIGETALIDLVGVLGYYAFISMTLNVFDVALPAGASPPLTDGRADSANPTQRP